MDQQLTLFVAPPAPPKARGRAISATEIRALYLRLRDIKQVAKALKIHERRVRPLVQDLRPQLWAKRVKPILPAPSTVPVGTRWRCQCCGVVMTVTPETEQEPTCRRGTRAPWLPLPNPFTEAERRPPHSRKV